MHNFPSTKKEDLFSGPYEKYRCRFDSLFTNGKEERFAAYLSDLFSEEAEDTDGDLITDGHYILGEVGYSRLKDALDGEEAGTMINDQTEVSWYVRRQFESLRENAAQKKLVVISGGPGTGKTVVGMHFLKMYNDLFGQEGAKTKVAFTLPKNRTLVQFIQGETGLNVPYVDSLSNGHYDLIVIDEAHRMENVTGTLERLFQKANMIIVLQDDRQRIKLSEEGSVEHFEQFAKAHPGIQFYQSDLKIQKRSSLMKGYVDNVDQFFSNDPRAKAVDTAYQINVHDSLTGINESLVNHQQQGETAMWYAPYCWEWISKNKPHSPDRDICIDEDSSRFEKYWNPMNEQYMWLKNTRQNAIDYVGCVHTAQGLEFDYVGIIFWDDLVWRDGKWDIDLTQIKDAGFIRNIVQSLSKQAFFDADTMKVKVNGDHMPLMAFVRLHEDRMNEVIQLILNIYRILFTRARKGVYVWFKDQQTKEQFKSFVSGPATEVQDL